MLFCPKIDFATKNITNKPPRSKFSYPILGDTIKIVKSACLWSKGLSRQGNAIRAHVRYLDGTFKKKTVYHLSGMEGMQAFYNQDNVSRGNVSTIIDPYLTDGTKITANTMNQEEHKERKGILLSAFHSPKHTHHFLNVLRDITNQFHADIKTKAKVYKYTTFQFDSMFRDFVARFSTQFLWSHEADDELVKKIRKMTGHLSSFRPASVPFSPFKRGLAIAKELRDFSHGRLAEHRAEPDKFTDTMKYLMTAQPPLANDAIVMELNNMLISLQQVATAFSAAVISILKSKKTALYNKIMVELEQNQNIINSRRDDAWMHINIESKFPNLTNAIKEAFRLFPVNPLQIGTSSRDFWVDGYRIPKGKIVVGGLWATGFDYNLYKDPEGYRPDRYKMQDLTTEKGIDWSPFGCGYSARTHRCPGQSIVLNVCTYLIARLLSDFDLELTSPKQDFDYHKIFPSPQDGLPLDIKIRPLEKVGILIG
ncbi:hypothetical protein G9A89_002303 [Geosiphon pyriformis]|nr:hypothetical protein G9A89_002303 [Geosiphon pyriformis]